MSRGCKASLAKVVVVVEAEIDSEEAVRELSWQTPSDS